MELSDNYLDLSSGEIDVALLHPQSLNISLRNGYTLIASFGRIAQLSRRAWTSAYDLGAR